MISESIIRRVDSLVPLELRNDTGSLWQARIFVISHLLGPCLGAVILVFLYRADPMRGAPYWILCALASLFPMLPFAMRIIGRLTWPALFSVCDLTFLSVFGSYFYGGVSSPFLPWFLTALLLGFFYLGKRPFLVLGIFAVNLAGFCAAYVVHGGFPTHVPVAALSGVGVISACAATLYTSMMAIYYANVITAQSDLKREADRHEITAARMRDAKEKAERANEAKSVFLAKMSHHLRTPLNAVIGYSEMLLEDACLDGNDSQTADLEKINSAGRHLLSLVNDVLDMSKIDSENIELALTPFELGDLVSDVASTCRSLIERNGNKFVVDQGAELGTVVSDETRLRQAVINLLSNAGKFTTNGAVLLRVARERRADRDDIVIVVEDTGIGISAANLQKLFTDFNQADASTASKYGGTGLGLALSRRLCQLMQGDIEVRSEVGKGSTFIIRVPAFLALPTHDSDQTHAFAA
ncbi:MAG TPA: ATP-binding protein [Stellaceae bacterium]|nr:ATP-binding protein [Stellaceae bacterium]